ncbi:MAG: polyhydroxyalkanoic acid system family protein [Myxococcota bacterium]
MAKINLKHAHNLDRASAKQKVQELFDAFSSRFGIKTRWDGDTIVLSGSGFDGSAVVGDKDVDVNVNLGMMVSAFKGQVESGLKAELEKRLKA